MIARDRDSDANGSLDERLYALQDANFNVTAIADTSGDIVERYLFDPYGQRTILDPNFSADSGNTSDFAFMHGHQGGKYDSVLTNQMLFRNRVYDVETMRWLMEDPIGYVDGMSVFTAYVGAPTNYTDPSGLMIDPGTRSVVGLLKAGYTPKEIAAILGTVTAAQVVTIGVQQGLITPPAIPVVPATPPVTIPLTPSTPAAPALPRADITKAIEQLTQKIQDALRRNWDRCRPRCATELFDALRRLKQDNPNKGWENGTAFKDHWEAADDMAKWMDIHRQDVTKAKGAHAATINNRENRKGADRWTKDSKINHLEDTVNMCGSIRNGYTALVKCLRTAGTPIEKALSAPLLASMKAIMNKCKRYSNRGYREPEAADF